ncbi:MAG: 3-deoxy-8-phosphooctulonate synthase [Bacteroidota bacterium]|nr:3-deoxy-8-phosphooctulonate synthase [Bacteroidota bacterium]MDP4235192.1 3-deoxy-8-phosphooctulonate synthase [Bacteroidota bacterium]
MNDNVTISTPDKRKIAFFGSERFPVIAGPCLVESKELLVQVATELCRIQSVLPVDFIFKSSYRKANRTSGSTVSGIGDEKAISYLGEIQKEFSLPLLTDIHLPVEAAFAAEVCDVLQIPAFLSRQTDILEAAAETGKVVNIKKAQFMSPLDMKFAKEKVTKKGNSKVLLTERGTSFGYGDLIVDFRSLEIMKEFGSPVIYDATHSVQRPSQNGVSGGQRQFIAPLARAAMAVGIDGLFIETHPDPSKAKSDAESQLPLGELESLLRSLLQFRFKR